MRIAFIVLVFILGSCGGSLTSEQRKKLRENMEAKALKKVSDADLMSASFTYGRSIAKNIETKDKNLTLRPVLDSLQKSFGVEILALHKNDTGMRAVEKQIIEAYLSVTDLSTVGDNIQKMGKDTLLYTKPLMQERPDGSMAFSKVLAIRMPKKQVILSMDK